MTDNPLPHEEISRLARESARKDERIEELKAENRRLCDALKTMRGWTINKRVHEMIDAVLSNGEK